MIQAYVFAPESFPNWLLAINWKEVEGFLTGIGQMLVAVGESLIQIGQVIYRIVNR